MTRSPPPPSGRSPAIRFPGTLFTLACRVALPAIAWGGLWWLLTEGQRDSWWIGLPVVAAASYLSWSLGPQARCRVSVGGWLCFLPLFVAWMLLGAIDVAWRSLHPRLPILPGWITYPMRLPEGTSRVFFMNIVSLLPGTLSADVDQQLLIVHVFDTRRPAASKLVQLERAVARAFAVRLASAPAAAESRR